MIDNNNLKLVKDIFKGARRKYDLIERKENIKKEYMDFLDKSILLKHYKSIEYINAFSFLDSDNKEALIFTIIVSYSIPSGKFDLGGYDLQLIGLKELSSYSGQILIRPETISDKVSELFQKVEIDFPENPKFSKHYYFLSKNESLAREFASQKRLSVIEKNKDLYFEIQDKILLAKFDRAINYTDTIKLIDIMKNL